MHCYTVQVSATSVGDRNRHSTSASRVSIIKNKISSVGGASSHDDREGRDTGEDFGCPAVCLFPWMVWCRGVLLFYLFCFLNQEWNMEPRALHSTTEPN